MNHNSALKVKCKFHHNDNQSTNESLYIISHDVNMTIVMFEFNFNMRGEIRRLVAWRADFNTLLSENRWVILRAVMRLHPGFLSVLSTGTK